jgi:hypothetical protein
VTGGATIAAGCQPSGRYTKHAACHWLVNFTLKLAERVEPKREWRILSSQDHSTVWDGGQLLFDFNFQSMGITPQECFRLANESELKPGELLHVHLRALAARDARRVRS